MPESLKFLFLVQGEGRGHMTQAIRLAQILRQQGHSVEGVALGRSSRREIPSYFFESIQAPVIRLESPNFVTDKKAKAVRPWASIWRNAAKTARYKNSLKELDLWVDRHQADVLVNFYDFLGGMYVRQYRPKLKYIAVAHQYMAWHPSFQFAKGTAMHRKLYRLANSFTSFGASQVWALSFLPYAPQQQGRLRVMPPLMRSEVLDAEHSLGDYILAYVVNPGYGEELVEWSRNNPGRKIHAFWDHPEHPDSWQATADLWLHPLDGEHFFEKMKNCGAYASTAGFESICEAAYLGKPILMVPTKGQFEQGCNALEAEREGIGISDESFRLERLISGQATWQANKEIPGWFQATDQYVAGALEELMAQNSFAKNF